MEEIAKIFPAVFRQRFRSGPQLAELLASLWPRIVGQAMAQQSRPVRFAEGTLTLTTHCLAWAAQLRQMQEEIRAAINAFLGGSVVKKLRVEHILKPVADTPATPQRSPQPKLPAPRLERLDALAGLDPNVASILERSFAKYFARRGRQAH